jgi:hypothetical protein
VRATLHDELMREAGFETEYDSEVVRRRAARRRIARGVASFAVALGVFSGMLLDHGHVTRGAGWTLLVLSIAGAVCGAAVGWKERKRSRLMRALAGLMHPRRGLRRLWLGITGPWRNDS